MEQIKKAGSSLYVRIRALSVLKKVLLVIALILIGWFAFSRLSPGNTKAPITQTQTVAKGTITSTLESSGTVTSNSQVNVTSAATGVISEVYVENGDEVSAGQSLFAVTATATPEEKATSYASLLAAQNTLNAAKSKMNSLQAALFNANQEFVTGAGTENPTTSDPTYIQENATWLQAEADYTNQSGVIMQAEAALQAASLGYQATQNSLVTAPISGMVANFSATVGSAVSGGSSSANSSSDADSDSSSSTPVLIIGNYSDLVITLQVSEVDITTIKAGQKATVTIDALPDQTFVGTVASVDTVGTSSSGVVTYNATVKLSSPPETIKAGMTASVMVQLDRHENVVVIPTTAIQTVNGEKIVQVQKNGQSTPVVVTTGITSDSETEITSGLSEGDVIITTSQIQTSGTSGQTTSPFSGTRSFGGGGAAPVMIRQGGSAR